MNKPTILKINKLPNLFGIVVLTLLILTAPSNIKIAKAWCIPPCVCAPCVCSIITFTTVGAHVSQEHNITRFDVFGTSGGPIPVVWPIPIGPCLARMCEHETWLRGTFFAGVQSGQGVGGILPALMMMTEQFLAVMMQQMLIIGTFLDATIQLEAQRLFQELNIEAHKDYHKDVSMCIIGTNTRSLANADQRGEVTVAVMSQRSDQRHFGRRNANASEGKYEDSEGRLEQFRIKNCDEDDNNKIRQAAGAQPFNYVGVAGAPDPQTGLTILNSQGEPNCGVVSNLRTNRDIDYTTLVELPLTLDIEFPTGGAPTGEEEDILSMASYLYGHEAARRLPAFSQDIFSNQDDIMNMRSIVAKRSVAETSFFAIAGLKTRGNIGTSDDTFQYMERLLYELGHPPGTMQAIYGDYPSYLAQMEVLTKNIYMRPEFYTNLHGKVANLDRKSVAMQAIDLMLERDTFKNHIRTEAIISQLLEMEIIDYQRDISNTLRGLEADREP